MTNNAMNWNLISGKEPAASIILPTYNRAAFLPQAFDAIKGQQFQDWELIVVDDGSTDETKDLVARLASEVIQPVRYVYQENQGAYGARNTGLDLATGRYIAFYDSDDIWLPHHLQDCTLALEENSIVDWVYGACRIVEASSGKTLADNTFYENGKPRPFLRLRAARRGQLHLIEDSKTTRCMLLHGLYCGLQNSVIRRSVFGKKRFQTTYRNEAEDQLVVIRALAAGVRFGYLDNVHAIYNVHENNSSASSLSADLDKRLSVFRLMTRGFEDLARDTPMASADARALKERLGNDYFWNVGYALLWQNGRRNEALAMFRRGLKFRPWNVAFWKTYMVALLKMLFQPLAWKLVPARDE